MFAVLRKLIVSCPQSETVALHALLLTLYGAIFALVVGGFLLWHLYLASSVTFPHVYVTVLTLTLKSIQN